MFLLRMQMVVIKDNFFIIGLISYLKLDNSILIDSIFFINTLFICLQINSIILF